MCVRMCMRMCVRVCVRFALVGGRVQGLKPVVLSNVARCQRASLLLISTPPAVTNDSHTFAMVASYQRQQRGFFKQPSNLVVPVSILFSSHCYSYFIWQR